MSIDDINKTIGDIIRNHPENNPVFHKMIKDGISDFLWRKENAIYFEEYLKSGSDFFEISTAFEDAFFNFICTKTVGQENITKRDALLVLGSILNKSKKAIIANAKGKIKQRVENMKGWKEHRLYLFSLAKAAGFESPEEWLKNIEEQ